MVGSSPVSTALALAKAGLKIDKAVTAGSLSSPKILGFQLPNRNRFAPRLVSSKFEIHRLSPAVVSN